MRLNADENITGEFTAQIQAYVAKIKNRLIADLIFTIKLSRLVIPLRRGAYK